MKIEIKDLFRLFKMTYTEWIDKDPFRQSAVIAYYSIFSFPGLLVLVITVTGYFIGTKTVNQNIMAQISATMGTTTADQISGMLTVVSQSKSSVAGTILSIGILLFGATGVFVELQKSLNQVWKVTSVPQNGIFLFFKARLFSFGLIIGIAFLLLISFVISTALASVGNAIMVRTSEFMVIVFYLLNFILSLLVISGLFALMYKILPDARIEWKHVWLGALVTGLLFTIGKTALAFYFGKAHPASVYGAAGSVILILLWVSYSSIILLFGAEFTAAYAKMFTGKVLPTEIAVPELKTQ